MDYIIKRINDLRGDRTENVDMLLTKLIRDEGINYDKNINENYEVKDFYKKYLNEENMIILVAVDKEEQIKGYLFGFIENNGDVYKQCVAKIDAIYVEQLYRRKGIAKELINSFEEWCKVRQVAYVEIGVCKENEIAYKSYKKMGFDNFKVEMRKKIK